MFPDIALEIIWAAKHIEIDRNYRTYEKGMITMRKPLLSMSFLLALLSITGCASTPSILTFSDPSHSFEDYQSFSWISEKPLIVSGDRGPDSFISAVLQKTVVDTLKGKGFEFVQDASDADFVVLITVGARDELEVHREVNRYFKTRTRWGDSILGSNKSYQHIRPYSDGTLAIDIFDEKLKSPVWHSSAARELTRAELKGDSVESTKEAVRTLLSEFPTRSSSFRSQASMMLETL